MKANKNQPVSEKELAAGTEREMRKLLGKARQYINRAALELDALDADPSVKVEIWQKFNATERRLMKDRSGDQWSGPS